MNSSDFIRIHRLHQNSSDFFGIHRNSPKFIGLHQNSSNFAEFHLTSKFIRFHRNSSYFTEIYLTSLEFIGLHRNSLKFTELRRNSSDLEEFLGFRRTSPHFIGLLTNCTPKFKSEYPLINFLYKNLKWIQMCKSSTQIIIKKHIKIYNTLYLCYKEKKILDFVHAIKLTWLHETSNFCSCTRTHSARTNM